MTIYKCEMKELVYILFASKRYIEKRYKKKGNLKRVYFRIKGKVKEKRMVYLYTLPFLTDQNICKGRAL